MKRSKSALPQKIRKDNKCPQQKTNKKVLKCGHSKDTHMMENQSITQRPHTQRNKFQQHFNKIQQGFDDLQRNLNIDNNNNAGNSDQKNHAHAILTNRKITKQLFIGDSARKTAPKPHHKCLQYKNNQMIKLSQIKSSTRISNYHSCIYQKSLYDVIKILTIQKNQINRLNRQIKVIKGKK